MNDCERVRNFIHFHCFNNHDPLDVRWYLTGFVLYLTYSWSCNIYVHELNEIWWSINDFVVFNKENRLFVMLIVQVDFIFVIERDVFDFFEDERDSRLWLVLKHWKFRVDILCDFNQWEIFEHYDYEIFEISLVNPIDQFRERHYRFWWERDIFKCKFPLSLSDRCCWSFFQIKWIGYDWININILFCSSLFFVSFFDFCDTFV